MPNPNCFKPVFSNSASCSSSTRTVVPCLTLLTRLRVADYMEFFDMYDSRPTEACASGSRSALCDLNGLNLSLPYLLSIDSDYNELV